MKNSVLMTLVLCILLGTTGAALAKDKSHHACPCKDKHAVEVKKDEVKGQEDNVNMLNLNKENEKRDNRSTYLKEQIYSW